MDLRKPLIRWDALRLWPLDVFAYTKRELAEEQGKLQRAYEIQQAILIAKAEQDATSMTLIDAWKRVKAGFDNYKSFYNSEMAYHDYLPADVFDKHAIEMLDSLIQTSHK